MALKPYLQLIRLPNVFTAAADSLAGWLLVRGSFAEPGHWAPLVAASACTYAGGIILNDVFDLEVDRVERPNRPLPSGKVGFRTAWGLGVGLLIAGFVLAVVSATRYGWAVEAALIGCVLAYDAGLKRSPLGPEIMGACRGLNLLLGMSQAEHLGGPPAWLAAGSYAVFVAGVTWISRSEVHSGVWKNIALGVGLQNAAFLGLVTTCILAARFPNPRVGANFDIWPGVLALCAVIPIANPWSVDAVRKIPTQIVPRIIMYGIVVLVGCHVGEVMYVRGSQAAFGVWLGILALGVIASAVNQRSVDAIRTPSPQTIQRAVKFGIMSLVWLHVGLLLAVRGPMEAAVVALFWLPATYTGRWIYST